MNVNLATPLTAGTASLRRRVAVATGRTQLTLMSAQLLAGLGNLIVSLLAARLLPAGEYAEIVTFLALYLAVHVPAAALSAAGAINPRRAVDARARAVALATAVAVVIAVASVPIGSAVGLPAGMVVLLATALPGAAALGLGRGLAYARHDASAVRASLLAEPLTRAVLGLALMAALGAVGGALAAVVGGYLALAACHVEVGRWYLVRRAARVRVATPAVAGDGTAIGVGVSFVALAVLQTVDLVIANARLDDAAAGQFGALSTLGGAAAFATATVPLVLLPASARGDVRARQTGLRLTLVVGAVIALAGWAVSGPLVRLAFGRELSGGAHWLGPYLVAMAAFGVVRVLVATRWTDGDGAYVLRALTGALALHLLFLLGFGTSVGAVAVCTIATTAGLVAALALPRRTAGRAPVMPRPVPRRDPGRLRPRIGQPAQVDRAPQYESPPAGERARRWSSASRDAVLLGGLCVLAAVLRLGTSRGLWVDEAISVRQAQLSFSEMLADVRVSDVHPPLHHAILWLDVRLFGTSELAARLPSLLAGVLLVPALRWVGEVVYDRRTGWIAACFAAIAPFCVWYSQEARMYSLFMLFATITVGAQVEAIRYGRRGDWLLYAGATAALAWTQYFAILPVAVQQVAFAVVAWQRRADRQALARFSRSWLAAAALVVAALLPLLPIVHDQWAQYNDRSSGLVPGQAGAASSTIGDNISIYAVIANMIWAVWGYHADSTMVQLAALWPLAMLAGLVLLGRGRSGRSLLLLALVVVPLSALFLIGSTKRDLFELRYFSGAVPVILLLAARFVTSISRARATLVVAGAVAIGTFTAGLVDQQLNGANPRLYDFEGALSVVHARDDSPNAVLLYAPDYLGDVIAYYAPDLDTRPLGSAVPADASTVWVLASENVLDTEATSGRIGGVLAELEEQRQLVATIHRPNVRMWELR